MQLEAIYNKVAASFACCLWAKLEDVLYFVQEDICEISNSHKLPNFQVIIAAGLCDLTTKIHHKHGTEVFNDWSLQKLPMSALF